MKKEETEMDAYKASTLGHIKQIKEWALEFKHNDYIYQSFKNKVHLHGNIITIEEDFKRAYWKSARELKRDIDNIEEELGVVKC